MLLDDQFTKKSTQANQERGFYNKSVALQFKHQQYAIEHTDTNNIQKSSLVAHNCPLKSPRYGSVMSGYKPEVYFVLYVQTG